MFSRAIQPRLAGLLNRSAAVVILGPRQVGKTTLALAIGAERPSVYLDLESPRDLSRLSDPELYFEAHEDELVILDEIQRQPGLFQSLRGLIDSGRRRGKPHGRFLLLGSASMALLQQSAESLAGRVVYLELTGLLPTELPTDLATLDRLWLRGGLPDSFLATSDAESSEWRESFIRTYLERDIPMFGPRIPAATLRRLWTMLAHSQGGMLNASNLASSLGISGQTVTRYVDLLVDLMLVRRLPPFVHNAGKRLVRSPKVYVRDSGLAHALLGIETHDALLSHPIAGPSWEGLIIESLIAALPPGAEASFYRTSAGAELDLVIRFPNGTLWAVEVKRSSAPRPTIGFHNAREDIGAAHSFVVYPGAERFPLTKGVDAIGVHALMALLQGDGSHGDTPTRP